MLRCGVCVIRFRIPWLKIAWRPEDASINCEAIILKWLWEAFEQYITCKVPPNSPVKLPWFGVKAMIDDRFYGSMILKSLGGPPSHVMPGSSKFCLGSSMARHVSGSRGLRPRYVVESFFGMFRWNRSWVWMNFESPKTHQNTPATAATAATPQSLWQIFRWFRSKKESPAEICQAHQQKHPPVRWPGSSCGAATIVAGQGPYWFFGGFFIEGCVFFLFGLWPQKLQGSGNWTTWRARKARQVHRRLEF